MWQLWSLGLGFKDLREHLAISVFIVILIVTSTGTTPAFAAGTATAPLEITSCRLGVAETFKLGLWCPLWVEVVNRGEDMAGRLLVTLPDGSGSHCRFSTPELHLKAGENRVVELLVQVGQMSPSVTVRWEAEDGTTCERSFPPRSPGTNTSAIHVPSHEALFLWIGPGDFASFFRDWERQKKHWRQVTDPSKLPQHWLAYQSFRCIVVCPGEDASFAQQLQNSPQAVAALRQWVEIGGNRLIVSVGAAGRSLLDEDGVFHWLTPGKLIGQITVRRTTGLETLVQSNRPIVLRRGDVPLVAQQFDIQDGLVAAWEGNIPLAIRRGLGFGTGIVFTLDITHRALKEWQQWDKLMAWLIGLDAPDQPTATTQPRALMHYGYTDLAGQLRSSLEVFPRVSFLPFVWVAILTVIYLAVIGPLDYWLAGVLSKNRRWTWLTFPIFIVAASVVGWLVAGQKGHSIQVREVSCWDVDLVTRQARGYHWANIFSPRPAAYSIEVQPFARESAADKLEIRTGWLGIPGHSLGGMESAANVNLLPDRYDNVGGTQLVDFPIAQWATRAVWSTWHSPVVQPPLEYRLLDREGTLRGQIRNTSRYHLVDSVIVYGNWAYRVDNLPPGGLWEAGIGEEARELRAWLNGMEILLEGEGVRRQAHQQVKPYDQASRDPGYILRMMSLYRAGGGLAYAQLTHEYWPALDVTDWVLNNRAVFLCRAVVKDSPSPPEPDSGAIIRPARAESGPLNTVRQQEVFCRFLIPVIPYQPGKSATASPDSSPVESVPPLESRKN